MTESLSLPFSTIEEPRVDGFSILFLVSTILALFQRNMASCSVWNEGISIDELPSPSTFEAWTASSAVLDSSPSFLLLMWLSML